MDSDSLTKSDCLVLWLKTFVNVKDYINTITDVSDGTLLCMVINEIDYTYFHIDPSMSGDTQSQKDNLNTLVDDMQSYCDNIIKCETNIVVDVDKIIDKDEEACIDIVSWVLAVSLRSRNSDQMLTKISEMDKNAQNILGLIGQDYYNRFQSILDTSESIHDMSMKVNTNSNNTMMNNYQEEITTLTNANEQLKVENSNLKSELEYEKSQNQENQNIIAQLRKDVLAAGDTTSLVEQYEQKLHRNEGYIKDLQEEVDKEKKEHEIALQKVQIDLQEKEKSLSLSQSHIQELKLKVEQAKKSEKRINDLEKRLEEYKQYKQVNKQLEEDRDSIKQELIALQTKSEDVSSLTEKYKQLNDQNVKIQMENTNQQVEIQTMSARLQELMNENDELKRLNKDMEIQCMTNPSVDRNSIRMSTNTTDSFDTYDTFNIKEKEYQDQIKTLQIEVNTLKTQLQQGGSAQQQALASETERYNDLNKQQIQKMTQLNLENINLKKANSDQQRTIIALKQEMKGKDGLLTSLQEAQQEIVTLKTTIQQNEDIHQQQIKQYETKISQIQSSSSTADSRIQQSESKNKRAMEELETANRRNRLLLAQKGSYMREQEKMMACIHHLGNHILNQEYTNAVSNSRGHKWEEQANPMYQKARGLENALRKDNKL
ncbi:hypothetical protein WA158_007304 [Blastocystis sp. Blastoise]